MSSLRAKISSDEDISDVGGDGFEVLRRISVLDPQPWLRELAKG